MGVGPWPTHPDSILFPEYLRLRILIEFVRRPTTKAIQVRIQSCEPDRTSRVRFIPNGFVHDFGHYLKQPKSRSLGQHRLFPRIAGSVNSSGNPLVSSAFNKAAMSLFSDTAIPLTVSHAPPTQRFFQLMNEHRHSSMVHPGLGWGSSYISFENRTRAGGWEIKN